MQPSYKTTQKLLPHEDSMEINGFAVMLYLNSNETFDRFRTRLVEFA